MPTLTKSIYTLAFSSSLFFMGCRATEKSANANATLASAESTGGSLILNNINCSRLGSSATVAFFDADSTLRISKKGSVSANDPTDVYILPFAATKIAELNKKNILVAVVSNQQGVAKGYVTKEAAASALKYMASQLQKLGARIDTISMAIGEDEFRKPDIGMAKELFTSIQTKCRKSINMGESFMVGDSAYKKGSDGPSPDGRPADDFSNSDRGFAEKLNIAFYEPTDYFDWRAYNVFNIAKPEELKQFITVLSTKAPTEAANMKKINGL